MRKILYAALLGAFAILGYCGPAFPQLGPFAGPGAGGQTPPPLGGTGNWTAASLASPSTNATSSFVLSGMAAAGAQQAFVSSGTLQVFATGTMANGTLADGCAYELVFGPVAGATITGGSAVPATWSVLGSAKTMTQEVATDQTPFALSFMTQINPGANLALRYGFDVAIADVTGGTCTPKNIDLWAAEN